MVRLLLEAEAELDLAADLEWTPRPPRAPFLGGPIVGFGVFRAYRVYRVYRAHRVYRVYRV